MVRKYSRRTNKRTPSQALNSVSKLRRRRTHCPCGVELREDQALYCSIKCRNDFHSSAVTHNLQEPMSAKAVEVFEKTVAVRKEELTNAELETIRSQTPEDDSPEAEIRMRKMLDNKPGERFFVDTGYSYDE